MNQVQNVVFDRAAGYYDQTRSLPPHEAAQLADALWQVLGVTAATHVLEIGIGTGRIAGPLVQRGLTMTGVDLGDDPVASEDELMQRAFSSMNAQVEQGPPPADAAHSRKRPTAAQRRTVEGVGFQRCGFGR